MVVTGSESTGKTTLAEGLARHFGTIWVPEFARTYADEKLAQGKTLGPDDVEPIARGEIAWIDDAMPIADRLIVLDTDLVSTTVYARHYYGYCPPWIDEAARARRGDLYLLCDIDVPWLPGPHRDRPGHRAEIHGLFAEALAALGANSVTIRGSWSERWERASAAVQHALSVRTGRA